MEKGHIYFILGVSGSGKGTLREGIEKLNIGNIIMSISCTTREVRPSEENGVHYHFLSHREFKEGIDNGDFLEYAFVHKMNYYGTRYIDVIENGINTGKNVIKELDIIGLEKLKKEKPELEGDYSTIFLDLPREKFRERIEARGVPMSEDEYTKRLNSFDIERAKSKELCDYIIDATASKEEVLESVLGIIKGQIN